MSTVNASPGGSKDVPPPYTPSYVRVSSFRSPEFEVLLYSPNVKLEPTSFSWATSRTIPVYGDHDAVRGKIIVDPSCQSGRLVMSGTFSTQHDPDKFVPNGRPGRQKRIFLLTSRIIHVTPPDSDASRRSIRQVLGGRARNSRAPSSLFDPETTRTLPFSFDLGESQQLGEILPATVAPSVSKPSAIEVSYQLTVTWEPLKLTQQTSSLSIPIIVQAEPDSNSLDARSSDPGSWIEIPLRCPRPIPVRCAVTLPSSLTFSRASSIPFFVVFTTTPRSPTLAREIAGDATISISISSHISVTDTAPTASAAAAAESVLSDRSSALSDSRSSRFKRKIIKRLRSNSSSVSLASSIQSSDSHNNSSSPRPPQPLFSDTQTVYSGISIGFPKRPRHRAGGGKGHPSLEEHRALPDGLYKDKITLNREILASINWGGIEVKYFFEVSVLVGQDEMRAKVLLRIT
ncbi:hypothetical protein C8R46DRAFT_1287558 [Mycena filopes]|nr:hypothetical protein C8R46DRAFT_1287558 [Mycena filopes]